MTERVGFTRYGKVIILTESSPDGFVTTVSGGGVLDGETAQYATKDDAITGHRTMIKRVLKAIRAPKDPAAHMCPATGKMRFQTRELAEATIEPARAAMLKKGRGKLPVRAYQCEHCGDWHVTSKETWN